MKKSEVMAVKFPGMRRLHPSTTRFEQDIAPPLQHLLEISVELLGADKGSLQLYDAREGILKMITHVGFDQEFLNLFKSVRADISVCGSSVGSLRLGIVEDVFTNPNFKDLAAIYASYGIVAVQPAPLLSNDVKVIGILSTHFCRPHRPSERELRLLDLCVEDAVRVIEHKQVEQDMLTAVERPTQRNADVQQLNASLARSNQNLARSPFAATRALSLGSGGIAFNQSYAGQPVQFRSAAGRESMWGAYVRQVAHGDHSGLTALFRETSPLVFATAVRILSFRPDAEEITADVYAKIWRVARSYDEQRGSVASWLRTITRSLAFDRLRASALRTRCEVALSLNYCSATDLEGDLIAGQARERVVAALQALPYEQSRAIELAYFSGLTCPEIAKRIGEPVGTVKTRIRLGLIKLRRLLALAN
jgi:RNA polymerase sigma-70 factor (ECF subfamily)